MRFTFLWIRSTALVLAAARHAGATFSVALCALVFSACAAGRAAPTLATGERPVTGDARYDRFFSELGELLRKVDEAEREQEEVRGALARRVGSSENAPPEVLGARLRERTAKLAEGGLTLELEFTGIDDAEDGDLPPPGEPANTAAAGPATVAPAPVPSATLRTPGREPERRELRLLEVLARAAVSAAMIYAEMGHVQKRTPPLLEELGKLRARVPETFADAARRDTVRDQLEEAEQLLPELHDRARATGNAAEVLIAILDESANTAPTPASRRPTRGQNTRENAAGSGSERARRPAAKPAEAESSAGKATDFEP